VLLLQRRIQEAVWQLGLPTDCLRYVPAVAEADVVIHVRPGRREKQFSYDTVGGVFWWGFWGGRRAGGRGASGSGARRRPASGQGACLTLAGWAARPPARPRLQYRKQAAQKGIPFLSLHNETPGEVSGALLPAFKLYAGQATPAQVRHRWRRGRMRRAPNIKL
jgi:hypothetical protein